MIPVITKSRCGCTDLYCMPHTRFVAEIGVRSVMDQQDSSVQPESQALVDLALKVVLGQRGEYVVGYLENRRRQRVATRLDALRESAEEAGLTQHGLVERVEADDDYAEFTERVLEVASRSR